MFTRVYNVGMSNTTISPRWTFQPSDEPDLTDDMHVLKGTGWSIQVVESAFMRGSLRADGFCPCFEEGEGDEWGVTLYEDQMTMCLDAAKAFVEAQLKSA